MPLSSHELIGHNPEGAMRADLRVLCGIYDQLNAIRELLTPKAEAPPAARAPAALEVAPKPMRQKARKDKECPPPD